MTDRERQLEGIAKAVYGYEPDYADKAAVEILAALRAAGFDVYRVEDSDLIVSRGPNDSFGFAAGRYRLVPVGGEG